MTTESTPFQSQAAFKRAVDAAMVAIYRATEHSHDFTRALDGALKYEKKGRSSKYYAEAAMCESMLKGFDNKADAVDLFSFSNGCQQAYMVGAALAKAGRVTHDLRERLQVATAAAMTNTRQRMAAL